MTDSGNKGILGGKEIPQMSKEEFNDLDLDLDVQGDIEDNPEDGYYDDYSIDIEDEEEWEACIERLTSHCQKGWICLPITTEDHLFLGIYELEECDDKVFFEWVLKMWPPAKEMSHTPEDYSTASKKLAAIIHIASLHKSITS